MYVYKFNIYTKKYYKYDIDEVDLLSSMFDDNLHNNELYPVPLERNVCKYCNSMFLTRNKLFYHLGFMNIDIRKDQNEMLYDEFNDELGDFGLEKKKRNKRQQRRFQTYLKSKITKRKKKSAIKDLTKLFNEKIVL